jgi:hypothetical protein
MNNNNYYNTLKKSSTRAARPPSCARPTISSLCKMNRTFSLNNVSDVNSNQNQIANNNNINNILLPLTQASLSIAANSAAISSSSSFGGPNQQMNNNNNNGGQQNMSIINEEKQNNFMLLNQLNRQNLKLSSKYASSNYLNDIGSSYSTIISHKNTTPTMTTPRRRTPRNAEEFLHAAGVKDPAQFLNKGFYVGSMFNLNELHNLSSSSQNNNSSNSNQSENNNNNVNNNDNHSLLNNQSCSSSSSMNYFQTPNLNSLKRRSSIQDANSSSMANLNLNLNSNGTSNRVPNSYFKHQNGGVSKRAMTTAIHNLHHDQDMDTGSSDISSASPTPSSLLPQQSTQQANHHHRGGSSLGPLMRAVQTISPSAHNNSAISSSSPSSNPKTHKLDAEQNDFMDDYEYLERNLGAEPKFDIKNQNELNQNKTIMAKIQNKNVNNTTNTDYFTDESASCTNDELLNHNNYKINTNNEFLQTPSFLLPQNSSPIQTNKNNLNQNMLNNINYNSKQINNLKRPVNNITSNNNNNNNWDHQSVTSNTSIFSGLYLHSNSFTYTSHIFYDTFILLD